MEPYYFQCPYCWEEISMTLDSSVRVQTYIEDCEICCNPIELHIIFEQGNLISIDITNIEQ